METTAIQKTHSGIQDNSRAGSSEHLLSDFEIILTDEGIAYTKHAVYLQIGQNIPEYCWAVYLSVTKQQMPGLLSRLIPALTNLRVTYFIPASSTIHSTIMDGGLGYDQVGKVIVIYPLDATTAKEAAQMLIAETRENFGPDIPSARHLDNCVFTEFVYLGDQNRISLPNQSAWPFKGINSGKSSKLKKWHQGKYLQLYSLKNDVKGNVYKGFNLTKWLNAEWCIIKQGNRHHCADDAGRSIKDRLLWQFEVQSLLHGAVALPRAIDFFEEDGNSYFIMEYVEGSSLLESIGKVQNGTIWYELSLQSQSLLIGYLLQIIEIVDAFHNRGYVHRDLNPANFIVSRENKIVAIDIELSYDLNHNKPFPAFPLGTPGYMSPAQTQMAVPVIQDDVYGLGGLMIKVLTGISPTKFNYGNPSSLYDSLMFLINNQRMASVISSCLKNNADDRPTMVSLKHNLEVFHSVLLTQNKTDKLFHSDNSEFKKNNNNIDQALKSIWKSPLLGLNSKWYSKANNEDPLISNEFKSYTWYPGFHTGCCGILYLLVIADQMGFDLAQKRDAFYFNYQELRAYYVNNMSTSEPGLYSGAAGFSVLTAKMIQTGLIENSIQNINQLASLLSFPNPYINLRDGIAGQGLAAMQCSSLLSFPAFTKELSTIAEAIIKEQNFDGSWAVKKDPSMRKGVKHTGLLYGVAGIIYFLLEYGERYYSERAKNAAIRGLNWLLKHRQLKNGNYIWQASPQNSSVDPWLEFGFSGIALVFIKAFELLKLTVYKQAASSALLSHPQYISSNYITQSGGLAGLGEVYLEAHRILKDEEWIDRASHIVSVLLHTAKVQLSGDLYWLEGSDSTPTADFMIGNSGIIHFLLRYNNPSKIKFPLIGL
ncbi:lanthionine synthetase LanC family protein [Mucilaginibacter sp. RCC_168]|uniref:lanthionine synthetase LanC family protein n=1 Tax=Mucilaginibacter sp. RCC_168 TaxID=3239221 RepID=UPI00352583E4